MKTLALAFMLSATRASAQTSTFECTATLKDFQYFGTSTDFQYDKRHVQNGEVYRFNFKDPLLRESNAMVALGETADGLEVQIAIGHPEHRTSRSANDFCTRKVFQYGPHQSGAQPKRHHWLHARMQSNPLNKRDTDMKNIFIALALLSSTISAWAAEEPIALGCYKGTRNLLPALGFSYEDAPQAAVHLCKGARTEFGPFDCFQKAYPVLRAEVQSDWNSRQRDLALELCAGQ
jgi:hypothetical protein